MEGQYSNKFVQFKRKPQKTYFVRKISTYLKGKVN